MKKDQKQKNQQNQPQESPNLLRYKSNKFSFIEDNSKSLINLFILLTVVVQIAFITLVGFNFYLNNSLTKLDDEVAKLSSSFSSKEFVIEDARRLNKKLSIYKTAESERVRMGVRFSHIFNSLSIALLEEAQLSKSNATVQIRVSDALRVSVIISRLLDSDIVSQIAIQSARLARGQDANNYEVTLGIYY